MPVEVIKYRCQFKCGTKAKSSLKSINFHEQICFKNPERKACTTCKHEIYEKDGCDHPELEGCPSEQWMNRSCKKIDDDEFEMLVGICEFHNKPVFHVPPIYDCPFWELKD